jgi:hypothetical protein
MDFFFYFFGWNKASEAPTVMEFYFFIAFSEANNFCGADRNRSMTLHTLEMMIIFKNLNGRYIKVVTINL